MSKEKSYKIDRSNIEIYYDGRYPCLCMGKLVVTIEGVPYDFGNSALISGGYCGFDNNYEDSYTSDGPWDLNDDYWPKDLLISYRTIILERINEEIPWGCCGGCL